MVRVLILIANSGNASEDALERLIGEYPSHDYVIDRTEAEEIFVNVREPDDDETLLAYALQKLSRLPREYEDIDTDYFEIVNDTAEEFFESQQSETETETDTNRDEEDDTQNDIVESTSRDEPIADAQDIEEAGGDVPVEKDDGQGGKVTQIKNV